MAALTCLSREVADFIAAELKNLELSYKNVRNRA